MQIKKLLFVVLFLFLISARALSTASGSIYFPPLSDNAWETLSTDSLGSGHQHIDSLLRFLEEQNSNASGQISPGFNDSAWIYLNEIMEKPTNDNGFAGGSGTAEDPWLIADAEQLDMLRQYLGTAHADKHFRQIDHICLDQPPYNQGQGWEPIGTSANAFHGHYDGNGHVISGLTINRPATNNVGLWAFVGENGTVTNLGLQNTQVAGGNYVAGTMIAFNRGTLTEVYATGSVSGGYRVGGLVGDSKGGTIINSYATGPATGGGAVGGLIGYLWQTNVSNTYSHRPLPYPSM